eukprot:SRR837773.9056.p1 GENE.SRR837773.9056~~SRR837773.9056.p1  ORF type:complete len:443 (+),score=101.86 SRR837773.9056:241-1569(+)
MPSLLSKEGLHGLFHPQDFIRRLHHKDRDLGGWCIPHRRACKDPLDAVKKLEGDVNELMVHNPEMQWYEGSESLNNKTVGLDDGVCHHLSEDVHKHLHTILDLIKFLTRDPLEQEACQKHMQLTDAVELLEQLIAADLPVQLLAQLPLLEFETRKDIMNVCCALLWSGMPQQVDKHVVEYFRDHPRVFRLLVDGYAHEEVALHYGVVLRSCARHKELVRAFFASGEVTRLIKYASHRSIDVSSDAFYTLREMILEHKDVSSAWLGAAGGHVPFFRLYNELLASGEYVAERQAQKLLAEILLDRHFRQVMLDYVGNERNLQINMILLKDKSKAIQLEAFHVFKIFAVNPQKTKRVQQILYKNKDKLMALLEMLPGSRPDDKKLADEIRNVTERLRILDAPFSPTMSKDLSDATLSMSANNSGSECARSDGARSELSTSASTSL